jgi:hypothetical protein
MAQASQKQKRVVKKAGAPRLHNYCEGNINAISVCFTPKTVYIHTYHSRFIPKGVVEASQILLRDAHVLPKLFSYEKYCRRDSR